MSSTDPARGFPPARDFCVINLGCKVNRTESDTIAAALLACGGRRASREEADLIVVNTCIVTGEAEKKTRKAVRGALRANAGAAVVVTGCAVAIDAARWEQLDPRVRAVPRAELLGAIAALDPRELLRLGDAFRTRVNIKVQDGCDHACTYCIVRRARGRASSAPFRQVCDEVAAYSARGAGEVVLAGIDLGSYRSDGKGLAALLDALREICARQAPPGSHPCRIRISSIEPRSVDADLIALLAESDGSVCRHLHLPLQAGSSRVLAQMGRPYDAAFYRKLVEQLYRRVPSLSLSTDIICGFPGEADADFEETCTVAREARFSKIHGFPYSPREGTPAAARTDQVPPAEKAERTARLLALGDCLRDEDRQRRRGTTELVLIEPASGLTESYHEIPWKGDFRVGDLVPLALP